MWRLRLTALLGAGVFAVHQLRFLLAFGHSSGARLASEGHAYLVPLAPVVVWLLLALFVRVLAGGRASEAPPPLRTLWAGATAALVCAYCTQELVEGFVANGHPAGLGGIFGGGGWLALPLALAVGLVVALLVRGGARVVERRPWSAPALAPLRTARSGARMLAAAVAPIPASSARGPPLVSAMS